MKEKFIHFIIKSGFILFIIFGAFLFIVNVDSFSISPLEDKMAIFGIGISIGGLLLLWLLLEFGEKIKFLNNFFKKPLVKEVMRGLSKVLIFIWASIILWGLLKELFTN